MAESDAWNHHISRPFIPESLSSWRQKTTNVNLLIKFQKRHLTWNDLKWAYEVWTPSNFITIYFIY